MPLSSKQEIVALVGFMGAGKTSVGRALARLLKWRFIDLDDWIERRTGRTVAEIFAAAGEPEFREIETHALADALGNRDRNLVLALGGGAFVQKRNMQLLRAHRVHTVFLDATVEELRKRCARRPGKRPLFQDEHQFRQLYESRRPSYMQAKVRIVSDSRKVTEVAQELIARLALAPATATTTKGLSDVD